MSKKYTGTEGVDYVVCKLCNKRFKLLDSHLPRTHNITKEKYLKLYPDALIICDVSIQHRKDAQDKINKTNLERYGVERPTQSQIFRDKVKVTNIERFGADHPMKTEASKDKYKKTSTENYGVDHPWKSEEVQDEIKKRNLRDYGVEYLLESDEIQAKIRQTNLERYGSEWLFGTKFFQDKRAIKLLNKYGVEHPIQNEIIMNKKKRTCFEKYGVECPLVANIIKDKIKQTNLEKYGFEYYSQSEEGKIKNSCSQRGIMIDDFDGFYCDKDDWRNWHNVIYLNDKFKGCDRHHITKTIVVCIPGELHRHISHNLKTGRGMAEMNMLALQFINGGL